MNRSIRLTLTLWYIGILTAILSLFASVFYGRVAGDRLQDMDQLIAYEADGTADAIMAFRRAQAETQPGRMLQKEMEEGKLSALVADWAQKTGELEGDHPVRVMDRSGRVLQASSNFKNLEISLSRAVLKRVCHGRAFFETFPLSHHRMRLITWPVIERGRVLYLVQVAASLEQIDIALKRLRALLFWLIPLTLVVASVGGWFLATTALRPVGQMIAQAQQIGVEHLHERIDVPRTADELELLATTFNDMLARLEQAFRRMRQFSAAASHELRTPLTVMKGELEVALRRSRDVGEYQRVLRTHLETINEMADTVEQLLALARSEGGTSALEWLPVELGTLARQTGDAWLPVASAKKIFLDVSSGQAVWMRGERRLLTRLVGNLLDNAIHYTPENGKITLRATARGSEVCLEVQDTGQGIAPEDFPNLFEKFFTRPAPGEDSRSTGLGLGLCRWIAEAHRGRIEVKSAPGEGSTFTVWLPAMNKV